MNSVIQSRRIFNVDQSITSTMAIDAKFPTTKALL